MCPHLLVDANNILQQSFLPSWRLCVRRLEVWVDSLCPYGIFSTSSQNRTNIAHSAASFVRAEVAKED
jgi:hypothetical protein